MYGAAITGQVSGIGFSTHIISMCCSTNAGRHILSEGSRQYWTAIDRSIRTGSNLSRKQIFITGTKEAFVAKYQVRHLKSFCPDVKVEIFKGMNHGQMLIDHPDQIAERIIQITKTL